MFLKNKYARKLSHGKKKCGTSVSRIGQKENDKIKRKGIVILRRLKRQKGRRKQYY